MTKNGLSEDAAHRLIARAIELDARRAEEVSIAQLREFAQESGISLQAFEDALHEVASVAAPKPTMRDRFRKWMRRDQAVSPTRSILDRIFVNVVALGAFWASGLILGRAGDALTTTWVGQSGGILVANLLGVVMARRLGARVTTYFLSVTAIAQTAEFALHLRYGIDSVQSGPTHMAVLLASVLGVATGIIASRRQVAGAADSAEVVQPTDDRGRDVTLRLRLT